MLASGMCSHGLPALTKLPCIPQTTMSDEGASLVESSISAADVEDASEMTQEGRTATQLEAAMDLRLGHAIRLSREEDRHTEAADILGELLQTA